MDDHAVFNAEFDANGYGRKLFFYSALDPRELAAKAEELWPGVTARVQEGDSWLAGGEIGKGPHKGLLLALLCGYQPGEYELILERMQHIHERIASRRWGDVVSQLWQVAHPQPGLGSRSRERHVV